MRTILLPVTALWRREMLRFIRQRSRVSGAFLQPLVFWLLLGGGLNASFQPAGAPVGTSYVTYFYPGTIALVLLFTAIFSTISTVDDRKSGFLQGVLVAPVPRWLIVLGQTLGGTSLALLQGLLFLLFAPLLGLPLSLHQVAACVVAMTLIAVALTSLGLIIAWRMDSTQGFHAIMNLLLLPIWFLSGAFFPRQGAPLVLGWLMDINPLTYGVAALRHSFYLGNPAALSALPSYPIALLLTAVFAAATFALAVHSAQRRC
jgi:ABC-2 type transport system permease protein